MTIEYSSQALALNSALLFLFRRRLDESANYREGGLANCPLIAPSLRSFPNEMDGDTF